MDVPTAAQRQGGVFLASQAVAEGWSARQVRRRVVAGTWVYVAGRALAVPAATWTAFQLAMAIHLTWPEAVVSHRTAGALHRFPVAATVGGEAEATTRMRRRSSLRQVRLHHVRLRGEEVVRLASGVAVTRPVRTAVDCLASLPFHDALDLWAWVSTRGVLDVAGLQAAIKDRRYWKGTPQLRRLAAVVAEGAASGGEYRLHELLRDAGFTGWRAAVPVYDERGLIGVVDVLFEEARVVVEIDGFRAHGSQRAFVSDRRRQNRLTLAGYDVLRFTWDDLTQRPAEVVAEIRAMVREGLAQRCAR
jgi:very-short-patch-repair endonuclease